MMHAQIFHAMLKGGLTKSARDEVGEVCSSYVRQQCEAHGIVLESGHTPHELQTYGYQNRDPLLTSAQIHAIKGRFALKKVKYPLNGVDATDGEGVRPLFPTIPNCRFAHHDPLDVMQDPDLSAIICDLELIAFASMYLGCPATISISDLWWSFPADLPPGGMQHWHHDRGDFKSLNLFVYLTDVGKDCGPHMFIPRTHLAENVPHRDEIDDDGFNEFIERHRKSDEDTASHLWPPVMFTGPAGTTFWEDTRGFHKGLPPIVRPRLAFEVVYTVLPKFDHPDPIPRQGNPSPLVKYSTRYFYDWKE